MRRVSPVTVYPTVEMLIWKTATGLVLNEASINVPTYEIIYQDNRATPAPVTLPILEFTADENLVPGKSYNLYPMCKPILTYLDAY